MLPDYRERLYRAYVDQHMAEIRDISRRGLERDFPILEKTVGPFLPADKQAPILDLGCGYGGLVFFLSAKGYRNVCGIDRSQQMVAAAARLGVEGVRQGDFLSHLSVSAETYAMLTALDVVEHFRKDEIFPLLDGIYGALRPGGTFLMQTNNGMSKYGRWYRSSDFTHEVMFDAGSVRQCLRAAGFSEIRVVAVPPVVHGIPSAIRAVFWRLWEPWLKLSFAVEAGWQNGQVFTPIMIAVARKSTRSG